MKQFNSANLRRICIDNGWFTDGDIVQYQKFFQLNEDGASLEELALVLYICSSNVSREEILNKLKGVQK